MFRLLVIFLSITASDSIICFFFMLLSLRTTFYLFFFFSSRRRHTRYWRDWSSDVCSSDLHQFRPGAGSPDDAGTSAASGEELMTGRPFRTTRDIVNLRQGRNDWYRITNATATAPARIDIYDEIGWFGVTAADFVKDLAGVSGDLEVHINSPGGDVFEAHTIYTNLFQREGTVSVHVDGLAASAASFIAMAASPGRLVIAKNASMMIHDAFGMGVGNASDMRELADLLDMQSDIVAEVYAD